MHALRKIHQALTPGGLLIDFHPTGTHARAVAGGSELGFFDEREFRAEVQAAEASLAATVADGLFVLEVERSYEIAIRFGSAEELVEQAAGWRGCRIPPDLAARILSFGPPHEARQRMVLRVLRRLLLAPG